MYPRRTVRTLEELLGQSPTIRKRMHERTSMTLFQADMAWKCNFHCPVSALMKSLVRLRSLFSFLLAMSFPAMAQDSPKSDAASSYFGHIEAACNKAEDCSSIRQELALLDKCDDAKVDQRCEAAQQLLDKLFGGIYRENLPDLVLYLKQEKEGNFTKQRPVLIYEGKNTPYLYGVRFIHVLLISEHQAEMQASIATEYQREPNPLLFLFNLGAGLGATPDPDKAPESSEASIKWQPLNGGGQDSPLWLGYARLPVGGQSINRVTLRLGSAKTSLAKFTYTKEDDKPASYSMEREGELVDPSIPNITKSLAPKSAPSGDFLATTAHFSNSSASFAGASAALGVTFDTKGTGAAVSAENHAYNAYAFVELYAIRPRLYALPSSWLPYLDKKSLYRPSLGFVLGTNLTHGVLDELVYGVSIGHLVGNAGLILAANSIQPKKGDEDKGRKTRLLMGVEYSF